MLPKAWSEYFEREKVVPGFELWTMEHDRDLILGTIKYGYAQYESLLQDKSLIFYKTWEKDNTAEFPPLAEVGVRFRRIIAFCSRYMRKPETVAASLANYN